VRVLGSLLGRPRRNYSRSARAVQATKAKPASHARPV